MTVRLLHETKFPQQASVSRFVAKLHNDWIRTGKNELKNDVIICVTLDNPVIYKREDLRNGPCNADFIPLGAGVSEFKWLVKEPYPHHENTGGWVLTSNASCVGIFHFFNLQYDGKGRDRMNLTQNAIERTLGEYYKPEEFGMVDNYNPETDTSTHLDMMLKNKKIAGQDLFMTRERCDISWGFQNIWGANEKKEARLLMPKNTANNCQNNEHVSLAQMGQAKINVARLIANLQRQADLLE